ncbi:MAG: FKBP-type peptidyl-prolyl cis-trans isomerase [Bacteroidales bacterium]|jgi:FKBP-type peptidyl-prolyl cis-trans isomerase|nr:FKBP-type peptidyl-prolyl cis-trans isomerase [Bacteroidales bacterium]
MTLNNEKQKISYIIGENIGRSLVKDGYEVDIDILVSAIKDSVKGIDESGMTLEEKQECVRNWQAAEAVKQTASSSKAKEEGEAFLQRNKEQDKDVVETSTGLQYKVLKEGTGKKPKATDNVHVHYHGTLINGEVFDSSVERKEPISFPLNQVIAGWTEGLQMMPVGSKYRLFIPSHLAYGDQNVGSIPAGSTLIFDVELLDIK